MSLKMPELDQQVLARREGIIGALRRIVPGEGVFLGIVNADCVGLRSALPRVVHDAHGSRLSGTMPTKRVTEADSSYTRPSDADHRDVVRPRSGADFMRANTWVAAPGLIPGCPNLRWIPRSSHAVGGIVRFGQA